MAVAALRKDGRTALTLISDRTTPAQAEWSLRVIGFDGHEHRAERHTLELAPLSATAAGEWGDGELLHGADPTRTVAVFELHVGGEPVSRRVVYFDVAKALALPPDPGLRTQWRRDGDALVLELQAQRLARALWIDFEGIDAELSDNALTLLPGETVQITVESDAGQAELSNALRLRWIGKGSAPTDSPSSATASVAKPDRGNQR